MTGPIDDIGFINLVDKMQQDSALKIVNSARISYNTQKESFDEKDRKLCQFLIKNDHTSPFRHTFYTFHVKAPLFVFRQWVKYQVGSTWRKYEVDGQPVSIELIDVLFDTDKGCSWNEISGRYVELEPEFYFPKKIRTNPSHGNKQTSTTLSEDFDHESEIQSMKDDCDILFKSYRNRLERGVAKEQARMLLPQNIYTQAYWTVSLQGVMHMIVQRTDKHAQWEIQRYAARVFELLTEDDPELLHIFDSLD